MKPSIDIRELRDTRRLKGWLKEGQTVELRDGNRVLAHIVREEHVADFGEWPDFASRVRRTFGKRRLPGADLLIGEHSRF